MLYRYCPHCGVDIRFVPVKDGAPLPLTEREQEIAALIMRGYTNIQIAAALGIREKTIKACVYTIMQKMDAPNRTYLAVSLMRQGWTPERLLRVTPRVPYRRVRRRRPNRPVTPLAARRVA